MDISKNTTRTYVVTSLPASAPETADTLIAGQGYVFNTAGGNTADPNGGYIVYKIGDSVLTSNVIRPEWIKNATYNKSVDPVAQVDTLTVVIPKSTEKAAKGDYFSFTVMQNPGSVPSSVNAVFPMAAYTAEGDETAENIAKALVSAFNVSVSTQFDAPIVATSTGAVITLTAKDKNWNLYQKPYKQTTFQVTEVVNITKTSHKGATTGQGVGKAVAELESLTYGYSVPDRPWTAGLEAFTPELLADPAKKYDLLTIYYEAREFVTEETVIPTTYIFAIDSTIEVDNKKALIGAVNTILKTSISDSIEE